MRQHVYTPEQIAWLRKHRPSGPLAEVARRFRRRFSLTLSDGAISQTCIRRGIRDTTRGRFARGHTPWNKGLAVRVSPATELRPGNRPPNARVIGEYRQDHDGRWLLKVRENGAVGMSRRDWMPVSHLTYAAHHGPVPPGHVVMLLDGDETNGCLDPENLVCVSRAVLARANQDGYTELPPDRALRRAALAHAALKQGAHDRAKAAGLSLHARRQLLPRPGLQEAGHAD